MKRSEYTQLKNVTEISVITTDEDKFIYTKKDICGLYGVSEVTFRKFACNLGYKRDYCKKGSSHTAYYTQEVSDAFGLWLARNAALAGGQKTEINEKTGDIMGVKGFVSSAVKESAIATANFEKQLQLKTLEATISENNRVIAIENHAAEAERTLQEQERTLQEKEKRGTERETTKQLKIFAEYKVKIEEFAEFKKQAAKFEQYKNSPKTALYIGHDSVSTAYKIGFTTNIGKRTKCGVTDNPHLTYIYKLECSTRSAAEALEKKIHAELKEFNLQNWHKNLQPQEWFLLTPEQLDEIVTKYGFEKF